MKPELERYYADRLAMFASRGWKDLIEDVRHIVEANNRLEGVTVDNLQYKQGELSIFKWFLAIEEMSQKAYADLSVPVPPWTSDAETDDVQLTSVTH